MAKADNQMLLVESHIIKKANPLFKALDNLCFLSKNLYNVTLYYKRIKYIKDKQFINAYDIINEFTKTNQVDYRNLPANAAKYTIQLVDQNFKSFVALLKLKQKGKYDKDVNLPKYLHKTKGRQVVHYHKQALSLKNEGEIRLYRSDIVFKTKLKKEQIQYVKIVQCGHHIKIQVGYYKLKEDKKPKLNRYTSVDIGINNLMTVTSNVFDPVIYNGKPVKSINQFYNKQSSNEKSKLFKNHKLYTSKKLDNLSIWRMNQLNNYFHKITSQLVKLLEENQIDTVIIGRNKNWKDEISLRKRINQNFTSIPFAKLYGILQYKLELVGIDYIEQEESYSSKCSFIDREPVKKHKNYVGNRISRGLFRSKDGIKINADINGSMNIMRKYLEKNKLYNDNIHSELLSHINNPIRVNLETR